MIVAEVVLAFLFLGSVGVMLFCAFDLIRNQWVFNKRNELIDKFYDAQQKAIYAVFAETKRRIHDGDFDVNQSLVYQAGLMQEILAVEFDNVHGTYDEWFRHRLTWNVDKLVNQQAIAEMPFAYSIR